MTIFRVEGIVLHSFPFQDYDQIFTLLSPERGVIKCLLKGARSSKRQYGSATAPLTQAECVLKEGKGELFSCREIAILHSPLRLRDNLEKLECACILLNLIQQSQWPGKESLETYQLLKSYLKYLPDAQWPLSLVASFRLKLLKQEGLLSLGVPCSEFPSIWHFLQGETYCSTHAPSGSLGFIPQENRANASLCFLSIFKTPRSALYFHGIPIKNRTNVLLNHVYLIFLFIA